MLMPNDMLKDVPPKKKLRGKGKGRGKKDLLTSISPVVDVLEDESCECESEHGCDMMERAVYLRL